MNLLNKLTHKNLKLNKKRTIVTIIGITLSVALLTAVATMYASLIASLIKFEVGEKGNFHLAFYHVPLEEVVTFQNNREIDDIYITQDVGYAKLTNSLNPNKPYAFIKNFTAAALANLAINLTEGRLPENEDEILIPTHLKTNGGITYKVGDIVTLDVGSRVDNDGNILTQNNPYVIGEDNALTEQIINTEPKTYKIVGIISRPASSIEGYSAPGYTFISKSKENISSGVVDIYAHLTSKGAKNYSAILAGYLNVDASKLKLFLKGELDDSKENQIFYEKLATAPYQYDLNKYLIDLEVNP